MDDALDLVVDDNEFASEIPQACETQKSDAKQDAAAKLGPSFDPNDYISLSEAKKRLIESLEEYEMNDDVMVCSRGSVKSRLGVREEGHDVEFMDCSGSNDMPGSGIDEEGLCGNEGAGDGLLTKKTTARIPHRQEQVARRPNMKNLCKRLHVRWHDNPVKIGMELAERLEEHKFSLIINTVKTIGGKKAIELFHETKQIQLGAGMKTYNGSRRRTSGGVFLTLLKSSNYATEEQIKDIFKEDSKIKTEALKRKKHLYQQRRRARKLLEQQQAAANNSNNVEQPDSNTLQPDSNTVQPDSNTVQPDSKTVQPDNASSNSMQTDNNTNDIVQQVKEEQ